MIYQVDSKNERLFLSASFTAKFELFLVLTQEKVFSRDFQYSPPFERSACLYVTITGNFERFQYLNFEINFLESENLFQKMDHHKERSFPSNYFNFLKILFQFKNLS